MSLFERLFRPRRTTDEDRQAEAQKLESRRKHLRARISEDSTKIRRAWTDFRLGKDPAERKKLRAEIKVLEARRKAHVKEMLKVQSRMKKLGFAAAAGYVDMH